MNSKNENKRYDAITSVQKNLKIMREQAQEYIDKHNVNLPPICSSRHYLFLSMNGNKSKNVQKNIIIPSPSSSFSKDPTDFTISQLSPKIDRQSAQPTVYNLQLKKHLTPTLDHNNSYSRKVKVQENWRQMFHKRPLLNSQDIILNQSIQNKAEFQKMKNIVINSETLDQAVKKAKRRKEKLLSPQKSKLEHKKYHERFYSPERFQSLQIKDEKGQETQKTINFDQLRKQEKDLISTRRRFQHIVSPPASSPKFKVFTNSKPQKKKAIAKVDSQRMKKQELDLPFQPWQSPEGKDLEEIINLDKI